MLHLLYAVILLRLVPNLVPLELLVLLCRRLRVMPSVSEQDFSASRPSPIEHGEGTPLQQGGPLGGSPLNMPVSTSEVPQEQQHEDAQAGDAAEDLTGTSARSKRRAAKREKKLQKLLLKAQEEDKRKQMRELRQKFTEAPFDLPTAAAQGLVRPFVMGGNAPDTSTPGAPAAVAAAAAAAAAGQQRGDAGEEAVKGLFTGETPFLVINAKLRTVQAPEMLRPDEVEALSSGGGIPASEDLGAPGPEEANGGPGGAKSAQLLQAAWDEEYGKDAQTIFAQITYCGGPWCGIQSFFAFCPLLLYSCCAPGTVYSADERVCDELALQRRRTLPSFWRCR